MNPIDTIKLGHEVKVYIVHYALGGKDCPADQSKIWVVLNSTSIEDDWGSMFGLGCGYIDNPYPIDFFLDAEGQFKRTEVVGAIVDVKFMEHINGGRTNTKVYESISDYVADPVVRENVARKAKADIFDMILGDPDNVDAIVKFRIEGPTSFPAIYEVKQHLYGDIIPVEWYLEIHADVIAELQLVATFENADEALIGTNSEDDLFGSRLFPVIKAPKKLAEQMKEHAASFKGHSKLLFDNEHVYIGLRSTPNEIFEITDIYASGGAILNGRQWDW